MIFDRISLATAYSALRIIELNDGPVKDIIFNKTAWYGTKTIIKFKTTTELKNFINENYPYLYHVKGCQCATGPNEAIWNILSFNLRLDRDKRYATFVNNLRGEFESAQEAQFNKTSIDAVSKVFKNHTQLARLKANYSCFAYIQNQNRYVNECEYIEVITNKAYDELMAMYPSTRTSDLNVSDLLVNNNTYSPEAEVDVTETTTTTTTTNPNN